MNTHIALVYKVSDMPRHLNSVIAIAYRASISADVKAEIIDHIDKLQHPVFEIANRAYFALREHKKRGCIVDYAIAANRAEVLANLNQAITDSTGPKVTPPSMLHTIFQYLLGGTNQASAKQGRL